MSKRRSAQDTEIGGRDVFGRLMGRLDVLRAQGGSSSRVKVETLGRLLAQLERTVQDRRDEGVDTTHVSRVLGIWVKTLADDNVDDLFSEAVGLLKSLTPDSLSVTSPGAALTAPASSTAPDPRPDRHRPPQADDDRTNATVWELTITFSGTPKASAAALFIARVSRALESVEGVEVTILDAQEGSLRVRLGLRVPSPIEREQLKEILNRARQEAFAWYAKVPVEQQRKLAAEATAAETTAAAAANSDDRAALEHLSKVEQVRRQQLDNERLSLELETLRIKNRQLELELIAKASEVLQTALIDADDVRVVINDHLYFEVKKGRVLVREPLTVHEIADGELSGEIRD